MVTIVSSVSGFILLLAFLPMIAVQDASAKDNTLANGKPT